MEESLLVQLQQSTSSWTDVGYLHSSNNRIWLDFLESYWNLPDRPVLGQVFEERGRVWSPSSRVALPNWFSHLLPEGRLRQAVADAVDANVRNEFELLKRLGISDLPGAVRVVPVDAAGVVDVPQLAELEEIRDAGDPLLKFSLAGAQLKFSVYGTVGRGMTVPVAGQAGNVILKLADGRPGFGGVPESEFGCLRLAAESGIKAANARLMDPRSVAGLEGWAARSSGLALAVDRFDRRPDDVRIHMEELAQVLSIPTTENAKYSRANFETVAVLVEALCGTDAVAEVIDRIVLNVLVGNGDAHLKNWAVVYADGVHPGLSPVYDVLPTVLYLPKDDLGMKLNKSRDFEDVAFESFDRIGRRTAYGSIQAQVRARDAAGRILSSWPILSDHLSNEAFRALTVRLSTLRLAGARS